MILEEIKFDEENGNDYSVAIDHKGVIVYSECCADRMTRETAIAVRDGINEWLEKW